MEPIPLSPVVRCSYRSEWCLSSLDTFLNWLRFFFCWLLMCLSSRAPHTSRGCSQFMQIYVFDDGCGGLITKAFNPLSFRLNRTNPALNANVPFAACCRRHSPRQRLATRRARCVLVILIRKSVETLVIHFLFGFAPAITSDSVFVQAKRNMLIIPSGVGWLSLSEGPKQQPETVFESLVKHMSRLESHMTHSHPTRRVRVVNIQSIIFHLASSFLLTLNGRFSVFPFPRVLLIEKIIQLRRSRGERDGKNEEISWSQSATKAIIICQRRIKRRNR